MTLASLAVGGDEKGRYWSVRDELRQEHSFVVARDGGRAVRGEGVLERLFDYEEFLVGREDDSIRSERRLKPGSFVLRRGERLDLSGVVVGISYLGSEVRAQFPPECGTLEQESRAMGAQRPMRVLAWREQILQLVRNPGAAEGQGPEVAEVIRTLFNVEQSTIKLETVEIVLVPDADGMGLHAEGSFQTTHLPEVSSSVDLSSVNYRGSVQFRLLDAGVSMTRDVTYAYNGVLKADPLKTIQMTTHVRNTVQVLEHD